MSDKTTIARPYAKAIFELAQEKNTFDEWSKALALGAEISRNKQVSYLLKDPNFTVEKMQTLFLEIGKDVFFEKAKNLLGVLAEFKRLSYLPEIAEIFEQLREHAMRITTVQLISAFPVNDNDEKRFKAALKKRMDCDIHLECSVDKSILGGAIIKSGDLVIDGSIRGRLAQLSENLGIF